MKHKTAELEGALLDAAVALALGTEAQIVPPGQCWARFDGKPTLFKPSKLWQDGGPIIERELVSVVPPGYGGCAQWTAGIGLRNAYDGWEADHEAEGPTPLIAAMRAFVASKLGEEVELPG